MASPIEGSAPHPRHASRRLTGVAAALASLSIAAVAMINAQEAPGQGGGRPRLPAIRSDLLTHSTLVPCTGAVVPVSDTSRRIRVATWNIKAARSAPLEAIATELAAIRADVIALQEVDMGVRRTGYVDQPTLLAAALGFQYAFAASIKWDGGEYGLALLSRWPLSDVRRHNLEGIDAREPRIVLETTVCASGRPLRLYNHHADVRAPSRQAGLAGLRTIIEPQIGRGILVLGDFNEGPEADGVRSLLGAGLVDLGAAAAANTTAGERVDYLLADRVMASLISGMQVWTTGQSDHNAVIADLRW
jgi:endonuclease/exonuclease/phosphatase family metal-dependent hydrolase